MAKKSMGAVGRGEYSSPTPTSPTTPTATTPTSPTQITSDIRNQFGIGEALLNHPLYGAEIRRMLALRAAGNLAAAEELYYNSAWGKLDSDAQERILLQLENDKLYKERLNSWKIGIKQKLASRGLKADDAALDKYYLDGIDDATIIDQLAGGITAAGAAGTVATSLEKLRSVARANGFDLEKDFPNQVDTWLQRISKGEPVDDFVRLIRQQAKLGLPSKVQTLLDEGLDLANIYEPYRKTMATLLELQPDSISLNDPLLRSAYSPGYSNLTATPGMGGVSRGEYAGSEMSLYDFKRAVRKDPRWQYTDNARQEVSDIALNVLRNFGFQG